MQQQLLRKEMTSDINYFSEIRNNLVSTYIYWKGRGATGWATDIRFPASSHFIFVIVSKLALGDHPACYRMGTGCTLKTATGAWS
jgi:hypothetical protein